MRIRAVLRSWLAELTGEAAYARYLAHHAAAHPGEPPLPRAVFHRTETERRAAQIRRCC